MRTVASLVLLLAMARPVAGQVPGLPKQPAAPAQAAVEPAVDPLGRNTPRGTITTFAGAVYRSDFVTAAKCLQLRPTDRAPAKIETLTVDLNELMDRYFDQAVTSISDEPAGTLNDGLPPDQERVGTLKINDTRVDIMLVRVKEADVGYIWLVSTETLSKVPALQNSLTAPLIERVLPQALVDNEIFGLSWAHWITLAVSLAGLLVLLTIAFAVARFVVRAFIRHADRRRHFDDWDRAARTPLRILLALVLQLAILQRLGFPLTFRILYGRVALIGVVILAAWLARRMLRFGAERVIEMMPGVGHKNARSLILLGERAFSVIVVMVAIFAILTLLGADTSTALAGVGIGGVAVALGAQKSIENLIGAVFLLTDKVLAVGDSCTISNRDGTVEDITLRSVRLRTAEQSLLSIPAGVVAQAGIENFATRRKFLIQTTVRLRYGTTAAQLRRVLERIQTLLEADTRLEAGTSRARLVDFGEQAVEIQVVAYVLTADNTRFLAVREGVLLQIAEIVESSGSGFAQPTQFVYMDTSTSLPELPAKEDVRGSRH